jgi:hypothetical protein
MLETVYGNEALSCTHAFKRFRFRNGCEELEDNPWDGQPSTARNLETAANSS